MKDQEIKEADRYFTELHNSQSFEERKSTSPFILQQQINQIKIEKIRLKKAYERSLREANDHLKNCQNDLVKMYREAVR